MASITIRNLDDELKTRLRVEAAAHGHSMEEEARLILRRALAYPQPSVHLGSAIRERFAEYGDEGVEPPARSDRPRAADFDD